MGIHYAELIGSYILTFFCATYGSQTPFKVPISYRPLHVRKLQLLAVMIREFLAKLVRLATEEDRKEDTEFMFSGPYL